MNIGAHDLAVKMKNLKRMIDKGNNVKISVVLYGREKSRPDLAEKFFEQLLIQAEEFAKPAGTRSTKSLSLVMTAKSPPPKKQDDARA